jgi:hypothetical protein
VEPDETPHQPLFPRWTNTVVRLALFVVAATMVSVPTCLMLWVRTAYTTQADEPRPQPILFDHRHHVRDDGIDCRYCHDTVDSSPFAGVPPIDRCMGCHSQVWGDAPVLESLRRAAFTGAPIRWARVHNLPKFVFFDHSIHVRRGVGCASCHGRVDLMGQVRQVAPLTMGWCIDCHRDPAPHLRPLDRVTDMAWKPDRPELEVGRAIQQQLRIRPPLHCSGCHR